LEALCKNRNAYSISVLGEPDETIVTSLTCRELWAASNMLLHRSGSRVKRPAAGSNSKETGGLTGGLRVVGRLVGAISYLLGERSFANR